MSAIQSPGAATMARLLVSAADASPDRLFISSEIGKLTYREAERAVRRLAGGFASAGLSTSDRVCVMLPNSLDFVLTSIALSWIGCVEVPLNTALKGRVLTHQLVDSDAKAIILSGDYSPNVQGAWTDEVGIKTAIYASVATVAHGNWLPGVDSAHSLDVLATSHLIQEDPFSPSADDVSAIMYTSGTTGPSKGVLVSFAHAQTFASDWMRVVEFSADDVLLTCLPLFHSIARTLGLLPVLLIGAEMHIRSRFSASRFWDQVHQTRATVVHGVFGMVPILLNQDPSLKDKTHRARSFYIGPRVLSKQFEARFGVEVVEVYGSTETGIVTAAPKFVETPAESCGKPNEYSFDVDILDPSGVSTHAGEVGEIVVRPRTPHSVTAGYHANPAATEEAFRDNWFHTGDLGRRDEEGFYYFVDRQKDAMRRRGENISSMELESIANSYPSLIESAAFGVPSPLGEDDVMLCVVIQDGASFDFGDFLTFCSANMPNFMVPRYVEVLKTLPKTANGKIQKVALRSRGKSGLTATTWDREVAGPEHIGDQPSVPRSAEPLDLENRGVARRKEVS